MALCRRCGRRTSVPTDAAGSGRRRGPQKPSETSASDVFDPFVDCRPWIGLRSCRRDFHGGGSGIVRVSPVLIPVAIRYPGRVAFVSRRISSRGTWVLLSIPGARLYSIPRQLYCHSRGGGSARKGDRTQSTRGSGGSINRCPIFPAPVCPARRGGKSRLTDPHDWGEHRRIRQTSDGDGVRVSTVFGGLTHLLASRRPRSMAQGLPRSTSLSAPCWVSRADRAGIDCLASGRADRCLSARAGEAQHDGSNLPLDDHGGVARYRSSCVEPIFPSVSRQIS